MKKKYLLFSVFCCLLFIFSAQAQNIIYVNTSATGANNGSSWADAFTDFQVGVNSANASDSVFVAKGTYQPASGQSFSMKEGVKIYGGFAGTETSLSGRNLSSGDTSILKGNGSRVIYNNNNGLTAAAVLEGFTITGHINDNGAAMYNNLSSPAITNCIFSNNIADYNGGAIFNNFSSPVFTNCIFSGNKANNGGGMYNDNSSSAVIINCIFYGNYVLNGGGIYNENSSPTITNSIIYGNSNGPGVANYNSNSTPAITYSLIQGITADAANHNLDGSIYPKFVDSANGDFHLQPGSPAINVGNNSNITASDSTDLDGHSRIFNVANGGIVDLGPYEYQGIQITPDANGILYVDSAMSSPGDGGSWQKALPQLSDALNAAAFLNSQTSGAVKQIWVKKGTYKPLYKVSEEDKNGNPATDRDKSFVIVKDVQIYGGFSGTETLLNQRDMTKLFTVNNTILTGILGEGDSTYHVLISAGDVGSALMDGFIITGSSANVIRSVKVNGEDANSYGGSIYCINSSPAFSNITIENADGLLGGGMLIEQSAPILTNVTLRNNNAGDGGGMYVNQSSPTLTNVIIDNNMAIQGGGIYNNKSSLILTDVAVHNNAATSGGGGIVNYQCLSSTLTSVSITDNTTGQFGGGVLNAYSSPIFTNATIGNNIAGEGGGMYSAGSSNPVLRNSIIYGNSETNGKSEVYSDNTSATDYNYSLVDSVFYKINNPLDTISITGNDIFTNVATGDYTLRTGAWVINKGNNDYYSNNSIPDISVDMTDLAGNPRIFDKANGGIVDMGAYEYQGAPDSTIITSQPENIVACSSTDATLTVSATGANLHYQWQSSANGGEAWVNETNGTTETLELANIQTSDNGTQYRAVITGDWNIDTSNVVTITAFNVPVISAQPQSQSALEGASATISINATGINLHYQWQLYVRNGWNNITNATGAVFMIPSVSTKDAGAYQVIITGTCGQTISLPATLTVVTKPGQIPKPIPPGHLPPGCIPNISVQPTSQSICIHADAAFNVTASDATGYQWQYATGKGKKVWKNIANATGSTLTLSSVSGSDNGNQYRVIVSSNCGSITSKTATLKVERVAIVKEPQDAYVFLDKGPKGKENNKMANATFNVKAAGPGDISYQWQLSSDRSETWNDIPDATESSLTINNIKPNEDSLQYRVIVTGECNSVTSHVATLEVNEEPVKSAPPKGNKTPPGQAKKNIQHNYVVYPNPVTQSFVTIEDKLGNPLNGINLYDMTGHLLLSSQTQNAIINLQLPQLAAGTYMLQIIDQNHQAYPIQIVVQTTGQPLK